MLDHYALNKPQGLNGWRDWLRKAAKGIASLIPGGSLIYAAVAEIANEIDGSGFDWRSSFNTGANIPEDWNPTPAEEIVLNNFANTSLRAFFSYLVLIEEAIKGKTTYTEQLSEYNNLLKAYATFKDYHKNHEINGLSEYAILAKIELLDVFMRELSKRLNEIFNVSENTTISTSENTFKAGDEIGLGSLTLRVSTAFTSTFEAYMPKQVITINNATTGQSVTSNVSNPIVSVSLPVSKPVEEIKKEKTYLFGLVNFTKRPIASTLLTGLVVYGSYKAVKKLF